MCCFGELNTNLLTASTYFHAFHRFLRIEQAKKKYWNNMSKIILISEKTLITFFSRKIQKKDISRFVYAILHIIPQHINHRRNFLYAYACKSKNRVREAADKIDTDQGQMSFNNIVQSLTARKEQNVSDFKAGIQENIFANILKLSISDFY